MPGSQDLSDGKVVGKDADLPNFKADLLKKQDERQSNILLLIFLLIIGYVYLFGRFFVEILGLLQSGKLTDQNWHVLIFGIVLALVPAWIGSRLLNCVFSKEDNTHTDMGPIASLIKHLVSAKH